MHEAREGGHASAAPTSLVKVHFLPLITVVIFGIAAPVAADTMRTQ